MGTFVSQQVNSESKSKSRHAILSTHGCLGFIKVIKPKSLAFSI